MLSLKVFVPAGLCIILAGCSAESDQALPTRTVVPKHDAGLEYNAWVLCLDTSLSPLPDQFAKMKSIFHAVSVRDIRPNDLVWLCSTDTVGRPPALFELPAIGLTRSKKKTSGPAFLAEHRRLVNGISQLVQETDTTDLETTLDYMLNILRDQSHATRRVLVLGSDFIRDLGINNVTPEPPHAASKSSAHGIDVILLVARSKPQYLARLNVTANELSQIISTKWAQYFRDLGAENVSVRLVDSVPVGSY